MKEGDAAFYGPKIDIDVRDAIGRSWQLSTIQYDFNEPERFGLEYTGADNARHRPIMLHRALLGSVERFFGVMLEHYAGNFPTWLSPVQVRVLPVATAHEEYAEKVVDRIRAVGGRVDVVGAGDPLGKRIRAGKLEKIPYLLVVGDDDVADGTVGVNRRGSDKPERGVELASFVERFADEVMLAQAEAFALRVASRHHGARTALERVAQRLRHQRWSGGRGRRRRRRGRAGQRVQPHPRRRDCRTPRPTSSTGAPTCSSSSTPSRTRRGTCSCCRTARWPTSRR